MTTITITSQLPELGYFHGASRGANIPANQAMDGDLVYTVIRFINQIGVSMKVSCYTFAAAAGPLGLASHANDTVTAVVSLADGGHALVVSDGAKAIMVVSQDIPSVSALSSIDIPTAPDVAQAITSAVSQVVSGLAAMKALA